MIEAAALERVVNLARAVRGDDHDRRLRGLDRAQFRDRDLEIGEHFEQERLEGFVGAVEFVDQQHRRAGCVRLERLQQRTLDQEPLGENVMLDARAVVLAFGFRDADRDHLRGVVPLVDRGRNVKPLVALQPNEPPAKRRRQDLADLGLADARLAFEEDRPAHPQRQKQHRRERAVGEIVAGREQLQRRVDRGRKRCLLFIAAIYIRDCRACPVHRTRRFAMLPGRNKPPGPAGGAARLARAIRLANGYPAAATARRASTPTRWARYSALPWMSLIMPSDLTESPSSDFGEKRFFSASSNSFTRNTPLPPAPVTATRISELRFDTNTPTSA